MHKINSWHSKHKINSWLYIYTNIEKYKFWHLHDKASVVLCVHSIGPSWEMKKFAHFNPVQYFF